MLKRKKASILIVGIFLCLIIISLIPQSSENQYCCNKNVVDPHSAATLEGAENILITKINREAELSEYGVVNYDDTIEIKNLNNNPVTSIFIGIPLSQSENLIYFEATGKDENSLLVERESLIMNEFEMLAIYFDSPLLPQQSKDIGFVQTYKDMLIYEETGEDEQDITFNGFVFPILPYHSKGSIKAIYGYPDSSSIISFSDGGVHDRSEETITYQTTTLDPFLENLIQDPEPIITIVLEENEFTKIEIEELTREIFISPWGIIRVNEEYVIKNRGTLDVDKLHFEIPGPAREVRVYDDLGEILGVVLDPEENYTHLEYKDLDIDLSENRVTIDPNSKLKFNIEYFLPFEKYISLNWFQESMKINVFTTKSDFLGKDHEIKLIIEGCFSLDYISEPPDAIEYLEDAIILIFESEYVSPLESKTIQFTFTLNIFDLVLRPVVFILILILISSLYVLIVKTRKEESDLAAIKKEFLPISEIREFCSLYEEKIALIVEIRNAEEDVKRKKIIKKKYKNIVDKNQKKIEEIEREIIPFKKIISDIDVSFQNILSKLEVLEAERLSVKDGLNLLEARYKRGRLPSRAAYMKLSDNFLNRQKKIDRSIDKNIRTLRSYLL